MVQEKIILALKREELSQVRLALYKKVLSEMSALNLDMARPQEKDADRYYFWLRQQPFTQNTRITKWRIFRKICRILDPAVAQRINLRAWKFKEPNYDKDTLTVDEVASMANAARNPRDKLIILLLYESGIRPGELYGLKKPNIEFDSYGAILHVDGKTGPREVRVVQVTELLWHYTATLTRDELWGIQKFAIIKMIRDTAKRAGIKTDVTPYTFRHTRVTHLLPHITDSTAKVYFGWSPDTKMLRNYNHIKSRQIDPIIREVSGNLSFSVPLGVPRPTHQIPREGPEAGSYSVPQALQSRQFRRPQFPSGL